MSSDNNINNNSGNQTPRFNKLDNLKNNIAAKAATAAGGPMAGKAIETLNKIKNNPNNNGYTSNKNNRIGQANGNNSNTSDKPSDLDNNNSNGDTNTKQNGNNNPINKLGSMLGGNNSDKINENDSTVTKAVKTAKKIRRSMPIIAALAPFIISFLGLIIVVVIVMSQFAAIENFVAQIQVGVEKMLNFATGEGWTTNENVFFKKLETENKKYKLLSSNGESLDIPLVAATIHYDRLVDINAYEKNNIENEQYNDEQQDTAIVKKEQTASFYGVAGDMLGKVDTIKPGERKLLGHLVKTEITYTEFSANDIKGAGEAWLNYFNQAGVSISKDVCVPGNIICYYQQYLEYVKNTRNYAKQYDDILAYTKFEDLNLFYEAKEFIDAFNKSEDEKDKTSGLFVPKVTRTMDYETYKDYLRNVYIPYHYFYGAKKEDINPLDIENIIDEIFAQKDYYNYLFHNDNKDINGSCELADTTTESVNVDTSYIENLKVRVLNPSCGKSITCNNVEFVVSLKEYVMGVVYREIGVSTSTPVEALKANLIAAKSYTLGRRKPQDGYITMRNNTYDQVYCNLDKGCMHYSSNKKTAPSSAVRKYLSDAYDAVANDFLYNTASNNFTGSYRDTVSLCNKQGEAGSCMGQVDSVKLAREGKNYDEILSTFYTGKIGLIDITTKTVSFNTYECLIPAGVDTSGGAKCIGDYCFPVPYKYGHISSPYGYRNPIYKNGKYVSGGRLHAGIDLSSGGINGQSIYAYKAGIVEVVVSKCSATGYGCYVRLKHDCGNGKACYTVYGHMLSASNSHLKVGDKVQAGAVLGKVGSTGSSTGPHLHFETRDKNYKTYDPAQELRSDGFSFK